MKKSPPTSTAAKLQKTTSSKVADPDNPALTDDMLGAPVLKRGGELQIAPTKVLTSIRLDTDILDFFKSLRNRYQSKINETLRKAVKQELPHHPSRSARKQVGRHFNAQRATRK